MNRNGFDIGEYVSYGINGVCSIEDISRCGCLRA